MRRLVVLLRVLAVAIALGGAIDPACVPTRAGRPVVALIDAGAPDLTRALDGALARDYSVHPGAYAGAAATVIAGDALPPDPPALSGSVIAVAPSFTARRIEDLAIVAPVSTRPGTVARVDVAFRTVGLAGRRLRVDLHDVTTDGAPVLGDRAERAVASDAPVRLSLSAPVAGTAGRRFSVTVADVADPSVRASASFLVDVSPVEWRVVILEGRPSWPATFIRRALEADPRFAVAARVATSRGRAAVTGNATDLSTADVIVVGAPDALDAATARSLAQAARTRGAAVVLVADAAEAGAWASLSGIVRLREVQGVERRTIATPQGTLVGTSFAVPVALPPGAVPLATLDDGAAAVWQSPLGAGRVVVNGALDAWRYREREQNGFATFWRGVIADAAAAVPARISVWPDVRIAAPGAPVDVRVIVRDAQLSDPLTPSPPVAVRAERLGGTGVEASVPGAGVSREPIRLWPTPERGVFAGVISAPGAALAPGRYRIHAALVSSTEVNAAGVSVVIASDAPRTPGTLAPWATSRGGVAVTGVDAAVSAVARQLVASPPVPPQPSHVMRAVWWLPVFLLAVGLEWWIRRYYGLTP